MGVRGLGSVRAHRLLDNHDLDAERADDRSVLREGRRRHADEGGALECSQV